MIRAFPDHPSVLPGGEVVLRVSTTSPAFRVDFYRYGSGGMTPVHSSDWLDGRHVADHAPYQDWARHGWPAYRFAIPSTWTSGVYVGVLLEGDGDSGVFDPPDPTTPDGRHAKVLFVVRSAAPGPTASILYKVPLLTYHAYNCVTENGWCLYSVPGHLPVPPSVSLRRPGGGTGGFPWDIANFDPFDPTPRQTFVHWDAPFVRWLEGNGHPVDYCTDIDLHHDARLLTPYRLLISAGHDEYWSDAMRDNVERFVLAGGNVSFFSGNTCWWRVAFDDDDDDDDDDFTFHRTGEWSDPSGADRPENSLTGVSFRNGGERDRDHHPIPVGFQVQHADHWVYEGTGLHDGDYFGHGPEEYVVGYECDGADFDRAVLSRGGSAEPTGDDGTPPGFVILGIGDLEPSGWGTGNRAATMGVHTNRGTVFTAATTDWARLLTHPVVGQITANVIDRLG